MGSNPTLARLGPQGSSARIVLVNKPGLTQSTVSLADVGPPRQAPDYFAVQTMAAVLGGDFSSRLNMNLREKHEYTYGVYAGFSMLRTWGYLQSWGAFVADKTAPAIAEMRKEIDLLRESGVTDEELARAKTSMEQRIRYRFEGSSTTAPGTVVERVRIRRAARGSAAGAASHTLRAR